MRPATSALRRPLLGVLSFALVASVACRDDHVLQPAAGLADGAALLAAKAGPKDTLPFHIQQSFAAVPGSELVECTGGPALPRQLVAEGVVTPHLGRTRSLLTTDFCEVANDTLRLAGSAVHVGATGDSLRAIWSGVITDLQQGKGDLALEITLVGGSGWFDRTAGAVAATGAVDLARGTGWYRGTGAVWPYVPTATTAPPLVRETITTGTDHSCGLAISGEAYCWGNNANGQLGDGTMTTRLTPALVAGGLAFTQISAGKSFTCASTAAGVAYCWGTNLKGQLGNTDPTNRLVPTAVAGILTFVQISAGDEHACAVTGTGAAYCWGNNTWGQLGDGTVTERRTPTLVAGSRVLKVIRAGARHSCALSSTGAAFCWGTNIEGELGDGSTAIQRNAPVAVAGGLAFAHIAVGRIHNCALTEAGVAWCWGGNSGGGLGNGGFANSHVPTLVSGGLTFKRISIGTYHTCALTITGAAWCWGPNEDGELGNGTDNFYKRTPTPVAGGLTFSSISAGDAHTCAVTTVNVGYCWGDNTWGQQGDGTTVDRLTPGRVSGDVVGGLTFTQITSGDSHTCAMTAAGSGYCWGQNAHGQLGDAGSTLRSLIPLMVLGDLTFHEISAGGQHTCAVTTGNAAYCWGGNRVGQLGDGSTTDWLTPTAVSGGLTFARISAGSEHTCALSGSGAAYCWGSNASGQLGDGTTTSRQSPTLVAGGRAFRYISAGHAHTCATELSGQAWCWGSDGANVNLVPTAVPGGQVLAQLSAGAHYTCGLTREGITYCWGANTNGQLGDGTTNTSAAPVRVMGFVAGGTTASEPPPFAVVSAGSSHVCAVTVNGAIAACWGWNYYGQLGDGTTTEWHMPKGIDGYAFQQVSGGGYHSCALSGGRAYCWGRNGDGQLGDDGTTNRLTPTAVTRLFFKG